MKNIFTLLFFTLILIGTRSFAQEKNHDDLVSSQKASERPTAPPSLPGKFKIPDFGTPLVVQTDLNCYDHSSRGVVEWLINRARCTGELNPGAVVPINQEIPRLSASTQVRDAAWSKWYFKRKLADDDLGEAFWPNHYFEMPEVRARIPEGVHFEQDLLFTSHQGQIYEPTKLDEDGDVDTGYGVGLRPTGNSRHSPGQSADLWQNGGVHQQQVDKVKTWMKKHESPIYFIFKPLGADYWHAAYILGWNEKGFVVRDSSFGEHVRDSFRRGKASRDLMVMPYQYFLDSAKAAAGYRVRGQICPNPNEQGDFSRPQSLVSSDELPTFQFVAHQAADEKARLPTINVPPTVSNEEASRAPSRAAPPSDLAKQAQRYWIQGRLNSYNGFDQERPQEINQTPVPSWAVGYYRDESNGTITFAVAPNSGRPVQSLPQSTTRRRWFRRR